MSNAPDPAVQAAATANLEHFMERGPALSYAYTTYVVARDIDARAVLVGGLGGLGVGQMWSVAHTVDPDSPGYDTAPYVECPPSERESLADLDHGWAISMDERCRVVDDCTCMLCWQTERYERWRAR